MEEADKQAVQVEAAAEGDKQNWNNGNNWNNNNNNNWQQQNQFAQDCMHWRNKCNWHVSTNNDTYPWKPAAPLRTVSQSNLAPPTNAHTHIYAYTQRALEVEEADKQAVQVEAAAEGDKQNWNNGNNWNNNNNNWQQQNQWNNQNQFAQDCAHWRGKCGWVSTALRHTCMPSACYVSYLLFMQARAAVALPLNAPHTITHT